MRNRNVALSWALAAASARTGTFAGKRRHRTACILLALGICGLGVARGQEAATASVTPSRLVRPIDENALVTLRGNVRRDLTADRDLGPVEDGLPLRLYLILQRSPAQRAELDNLLARQQQPTAPEYHRWLAPKEFGARFGASPQDIAKLSAWLELHGLQVRSVLNNASMIDFAATAGQVRAVFHTQLHYYNIQGGKYAANAQDPQIPAALVPVVAGIEGLSKIPPQANHTPIRPVSYDAATHSWHNLDSAGDAKAFPAYSTGSGGYAVTPQDFYTIYNVNRIFSGGNLGANATIALVEYGDMQYGTVNATTGAATGGDVVTFRTLFGVPGTLNMHVYHGYGTVTCNDPGITGSEGEATLDAEWANALAPAANLIFMSCGGGPSTLAAIVDNNLSDAISNSFSIGELGATAADYSTDDALYEQAAAQGQTIFDAAGDSGVDYHSAGTAGTATYGFNINATAASPLVTAAGGTDFADSYDSDMGGPARSTYWGDANSTYYSDALGYIPETAWNDSCASSLLANRHGYAPAAYCALGPASNSSINGDVQGGGGGYSAHYAQPSYQSGIPGLSSSATERATPDISLLAANGSWGHWLILCDSSAAATACTSPSTFGGAGGTSFVAPQLGGIAALLVNQAGTRQGMWNPALYALAKAQFTAAATGTACYSNGQTSNTGVTTGLPASACIFNDITTGNNDVPCAAGAIDCFVDSGAGYGLLSTTGAGSLTIGYPSGPGYDLATGLGSINVYNLIANWNTAYTSTTGLTASATSIASTQSTLLTATVTGGTPAGSSGEVPALTGSVSFAAGPISLGSCTLSGGACALSVLGSALQGGPNSVTATFTGSGTYPASTSSIVTVALTPGGLSSQTVFNAATLQTGGIAANEFISIKGAGLGPATGVSSTMTTLLGGASVSIGGTAAYLTYAQDGQINALVPFGVGGTQTTIQVEVDGVMSSSVTVPVVSASPGIFTQAYGPGQAWIVNQDGTFNSSSNSAPRNTYVAFWLTGQGAVNAPPPDGIQPGSPYPTPMLPLSVSVGGVPLPAANVVFDGLVYSGEVQINLLIPANAPTGSAVSLVVTIGGASSRTDATIAIQ